MKSCGVMRNLLTVSLVCLAGALQADTINLVQNGDFTDDITGWSGGSWVKAADSTSPDGACAQFTGHQWFYRPTKLSTPSLVEGTTYRTSFLAALLVDDGVAGDAILYAHTQASTNHFITPTLTTTWQTYSFDFTATAADAASSTYEVSFLSGYGLEIGYAGATGGSTFGVDSVTLTAVPEPSTFSLLTASLVGLLAYAWRKRK